MAVKRVRGVSRGLQVLEAVAKHQPVNVAELARLLDEDKSTMQRTLMTLSDEKWIRAVPGTPPKWELTPRVYALAQTGQGHSDLRHRTRATLDRLRMETQESIMLAVPDRGRLITIEVLESTQMVRAAPFLGMIIQPRESAAGQAVLAYMNEQQQRELLAAEPDDALRAELAEVRKRGYSINDGAILRGSTNIGGAIRNHAGEPIAAIVVVALSERMPIEIRGKVGALVAAAADDLSKQGLS